MTTSRYGPQANTSHVRNTIDFIGNNIFGIVGGALTDPFTGAAPVDTTVAAARVGIEGVTV